MCWRIFPGQRGSSANVVDVVVWCGLAESYLELKQTRGCSCAGVIPRQNMLDSHPQPRPGGKETRLMDIENTNFWRDKAQDISFPSQAFIGGRFVDAASGKSFESINPATERAITSVAEGDAEDINRAVKAARKAFESGVWAHQSPAARKAVVRVIFTHYEPGRGFAGGGGGCCGCRLDGVVGAVEASGAVGAVRGSERASDERTED